MKKSSKKQKPIAKKARALTVKASVPVEIDANLTRQYEEQDRIIKTCKENGVFIWAFTTDKQGNGGAFYHSPETADQVILFLANVKEKIERITQGRLTLSPKL